MRDRARGFTLAELIVCIGIIMVLLGLIAPALADAYSQAKLTRDMSLVRQHAAAIQMYTQDFDDVYPYLGDGDPFVDAVHWWAPMLESGHFGQFSEIDPEGHVNGEQFFASYYMTVAAVAEPDLMRPGNVPPLDLFPSSPVRTASVLFPSSKGLEVKATGVVPIPYALNAFACDGPAWPAPVSFCDGSVTSGSCQDFLDGDLFYTENGIGVPIISTWFGVRGRDR